MKDGNRTLATSLKMSMKGSPTIWLHRYALAAVKMDAEAPTLKAAKNVAEETAVPRIRFMVQGAHIGRDILSAKRLRHGVVIDLPAAPRSFAIFRAHDDVIVGVELSLAIGEVSRNRDVVPGGLLQAIRLKAIASEADLSQSARSRRLGWCIAE